MWLGVVRVTPSSSSALSKRFLNIYTKRGVILAPQNDHFVSGIRLIKSPSMLVYDRNAATLFEENYNLAFTQQLP